MLTRRARRDPDSPPDPELEANRLRLVLTGPWPRFGDDEYPPGLAQAAAAGTVTACGWCGGPTEPISPPVLPDVPLPPTRPGSPGYVAAQRAHEAGREARRTAIDALSPVERLATEGWSTCPTCAEGVARYGERAWPVAVALGVVGARDGDPARDAILARYTDRVDVDGRGRPLAIREYGVVFGSTHFLALPPYHRGMQGRATPDRPVAAWSHLAFVVADADQARQWWWPNDDGEHVPVDELDLEKWPRVLDVVQAELADVRAGIHRSEIVPPPGDWQQPACWYCGVARAPRAAWERHDDRVWCGLPESCPTPTGHDVHDRTTAYGQLLGEPVDLQQTLRLAATGDGLRWWGEIPDADRPDPGTRPWAWVTGEDRERWNEWFDAAFHAVADRMATRAAERQQVDDMAALAAEAGRAAAVETVADAGKQIAGRVTKAIQRSQRRQASTPPGPTVTHRDQAAIDRVRQSPRSGRNRR